jgi:peroxiredoxin Q/BCP
MTLRTHLETVSLLLPDGHEATLGSLWQGQPLVLFFYPKDFTPGCTTQVCGFRDAFQDFQQAGALVVGVSSDSADSHQRFMATHRLPFPLVSDEKGQLRKLMGVPKTLGFLPGRVTYVLDASGAVRHQFNSQLQIDGHIQEALAVVRELTPVKS